MKTVFSRARILGAGWVTPLGGDLEGVTQAILGGEVAEVVEMPASIGDSIFLTTQVPGEVLERTAREPRMRRSSLISHCAVGAALACVEDAGFSVEELAGKRVSIFYATSDGGVIYTRRFYDGVYLKGAAGASPLLFPETVHNAPSSHIASLLGLSGESLSFIGDSASGFDALLAAARAVESGFCDLALAVGAEEVDLISCYGYSAWGVAATVEERKNRAVFSSGAGAVLLGKEEGGEGKKVRVGPGRFFSRRSKSVRELRELVGQISGGAVDAVISSNAGTAVGKAEDRMLREMFPAAQAYGVKGALGESLAAGSFWQVVFGRQILKRGVATRALLTAVGYNGQVSALTIE